MSLVPRKQNPARGLLFAIGGFAVVVLLWNMVMPSAGLQRWARPRFDRPFDATIWKEGRPFLPGKDGARGVRNPRYGIRYEMVDSLLRSRQLTGVGAARCQELLGVPDGIMNRKTILDSPPYGGRQSPTEQHILKSDQEVAFWSYCLGSQEQYLPRGAAFMGWDLSDGWGLVIEFRDGRVVATKVE